MPGIPLFGIGQASKSPYVTAKQLQNLYAEIRPQGEKSALVAYGTPGLDLFVDFGDTPVRGAIEFESKSVFYCVHRGTFYEVNNGGSKTARGTIGTTSGRVSISDNGTQVMIVDGSLGYIFNTLTNVFAQITDVDFPANPLTVTFLGGRFVVNFLNSGRFYCSALYDGLSWDALNFANAETNPDPIIAVWASNGQIALLGSKTTEYWGNSGAVDFPYSLVAGTATEWGLAATWSLTKFDNTMMALFKNRLGQVIVAKVNGYQPSKVSTPDMDSIINAYAATADASAFSYLLGGHSMYVINFPSAGESWLYDASTGFWSRMKSLGITRYRCEFAFPFLSRTIVADYSNGRLYKLNPLTYTENGSTIEREVIGETIRAPDGEFIDAKCLRLDMETGVGLPGIAFPYYVQNYLLLTGAAGGYASTPDSVLSSITLGIDIRAYVAATDWNVATRSVIVSKWLAAGNQRSYAFYIRADFIGLEWSTNGTAVTTAETSIGGEGFADGSSYWIRAAMQNDNGAGANVTTFYRSVDGVTWTVIGLKGLAGVTSIFDSTTEVEIGAQDAGAAANWSGKIYSATIRKFGLGTAVSFDANDGLIASTSFVSAATGETYTVNGSASITSEPAGAGGTNYRLPATPGANPQISLQISRDNGKTYGAEMFKTMGPQGEYGTRVEWRRLGSPRVFTPKIRITDAVPVCIVSASLNPAT